MERVFIKDAPKNLGQKVRLMGWVNSLREHGRVVFLDLRDRTGLVQVVFPESSPDYERAKKLTLESTVLVWGQVQERPGKAENPNLTTGKIEILAESLTVFSLAQPLPFDTKTDGREISEEKRLQYRYLDLRRERLKNNFLLRHQIINFLRAFLTQEGFVEIETPILTKSTPEGARDYIVPSRIQKGKFYALPQSPQQYKQLLQVAGFERYFQVARCLRDEDPRADRQPDFTQLDMEISFVEREDVMALNERLLIEIVRKIVPQKKIQEIPFPRLSFQEARQKYQSDRPDLRRDKNDPNLLAFSWVVDFPFFEKDKQGGWTFTHNPFSAPQPEHLDWLMKKENIGEIITTQYDIVLNGFEIGGGSIRNHRPEALKKVFEILGRKEEDIEANFGHMLKAFSYGCPPHGGIAWGLDRFVALLANEESIREVIAFPKTGDGRDLMMGVPSEVSPEQLRELGIKIVGEKNEG
ncbi:MAG: aspartate--tRNA ligase [Candidatus Nealsonbacteria bacterium]|nr:aspartate--tRNA ligase [Candidatus Nealsonbacteria bacterium]